MEQDSQPVLEDATFQSLLVACLEQLERGEELDRDALVREHPQFAEPLKEFLADQAMLREVATGVRDSRERSPAKPAVDHFDDETIDSSPKAGADSSAGETIRYVGEHEGRHYFTMDFVDGRSLAEEIREESLPPRRAAEIVRTAAETVHFAHEQGTVHRDLKPANVLLPADDVPHITDFGLAKMSESVDEESRAELTASCQILGAPSYMSPEQASGKQELVGPASDIYSLGAILYACLTGRAPFVADSPVDTRLQVMKKEPVSPRELNPSVPKDLETICLKCLIKELHKRYGTAREPADDLQRFLEGRPVVARPISPIRKAARWCRRNKAVAALLCLLFLSMAVGTDASASYAVAAVRHAQKEDRARAHAETAREQAEEQRRKAEAAQREAEEQRDIATKAKAQAGWSLSREAGARRESDRARKAEADARRTAEASLAKEEATRGGAASNRSTLANLRGSAATDDVPLGATGIRSVGSDKQQGRDRNHLDRRLLLFRQAAWLGMSVRFQKAARVELAGLYVDRRPGSSEPDQADLLLAGSAGSVSGKGIS